ncbi:MAG: hypothetical protein C5B51_23810 [Terriglobia bacterium]|nr:MAG: hypothetical protein C5B51_23810 [Terriglobia bacterium]
MAAPVQIFTLALFVHKETRRWIVHAKSLSAFAGLALLLTASVQAANKPSRSHVDNDMARAIEFQRQKDAADARQARMEAKHPTVPHSNSADRSADRDNSGQRVPDPGEAAYRDNKNTPSPEKREP